MPSIKALIFDLDGTLVDTLQDIADAMNKTLQAYGLAPHPAESYRQMVGWGMRRLLENTTASQPLAPAQFEVVLTSFTAEYRQHAVVKSCLYPGIDSLLRQLPSTVEKAILSNKEHGMTLQVVDRLLSGYGFGQVHGAKPGVPHKPDPTSLLSILKHYQLQPHQALYLGDSDVDMKTACAAGVRGIGAAWGFRGRAELQAAGATWVVERPEEVLSILDLAGNR